MCLARVGRVVDVSRGRGKVEFFDGKSLDEVDLTVAGAKAGEFVEVFGGLALSVLSAAEARARRSEWKAVMKASGAPA